jgi:hypothetical protein
MRGCRVTLSRTVPVVLGLLLSAAAPLKAGPPSDAVAAIEKLGGSVRPVGDDGKEWEVELHLQGRDLTDKGLAHVAALKNVVSLNLRDTKITDAGLVHLKGLTTLRTLHLERTQIGDAGIAHLTGLEKLEYLNLYETKITDASLVHLASLKKLNRLYLWQTKVTDEGVAKLAKALPELRIVRGVDLAKLPAADVKPINKTKAPVPQKWVAASDEKPSKSELGSQITVTFENKTAGKVKVVWIGYGGELKFYFDLAPGATRRQNSFSKATWVITDEQGNPLGHFLVGADEEALAVIPGKK